MFEIILLPHKEAVAAISSAHSLPCHGGSRSKAVDLVKIIYLYSRLKDRVGRVSSNKYGIGDT